MIASSGYAVTDRSYKVTMTRQAWPGAGLPAGRSGLRHQASAIVAARAGLDLALRSSSSLTIVHTEDHRTHERDTARTLRVLVQVVRHVRVPRAGVAEERP
jgi:hypothetical protein